MVREMAVCIAYRGCSAYEQAKITIRRCEHSHRSSDEHSGDNLCAHAWEDERKLHRTTRSPNNGPVLVRDTQSTHVLRAGRARVAHPISGQTANQFLNVRLDLEGYRMCNARARRKDWSLSHLDRMIIISR